MKTTIKLTVIAVTAVLTTCLSSCAIDQGSATPGYYKQATPADPKAKFGLFIEPAFQPAKVEPAK